MEHRTTRRFGRKRMLIVTLALAALATALFGATQVSAANPSRGHERGDCLRGVAAGLKLTHALDQLVEDGTITADQETTIIEKLSEKRVDRNFGCTGLALLRNGAISDAVVDLLGMERHEIRRAWLDGKSLTEIAADQGVDRDALVDAIIAALNERLDAAVEKGTITVEEKDEIVTFATPVIERAVDLHRGELREQSESGPDAESPATPDSMGLVITTA